MFFRRCKALPKSQRRHVCLFRHPQSPYIPHLSSSRLNTFLELKIENERLQRRLAELRVRAPSPSPPISGPSTSPVYSLRSSSVSRSSAPSVSLRPPDTPGALYPQQFARIPYDSLGPSAAQLQGSAYEPLGLHAYSGQYTSASSVQPPDDDLGNDDSRRKKVH